MTIEMTMRYAHLSPTVKRDAVAELDRPVPESDTQDFGHLMITGGKVV